MGSLAEELMNELNCETRPFQVLCKPEKLT